MNGAAAPYKKKKKKNEIKELMRIKNGRIILPAVLGITNRQLSFDTTQAAQKTKKNWGGITQTDSKVIS
jgi:hypothetical protein